MSTDKLARLIDELRQQGLSEAESKRAAFCVLTCAKGWSTAHVARFLGISRARVGQRVERLRRQADSGNMPITARLLAPGPCAPAQDPGLPVGFPASNWEDPAFADGLLELVA